MINCARVQAHSNRTEINHNRTDMLQPVRTVEEARGASDRKVSDSRDDRDLVPFLHALCHFIFASSLLHHQFHVFH